jgi:hypothetical protein
MQRMIQFQNVTIITSNARFHAHAHRASSTEHETALTSVPRQEKSPVLPGGRVQTQKNPNYRPLNSKGLLVVCSLKSCSCVESSESATAEMGSAITLY